MQGFRQELVSSAVQGSRMEGSLARRGERRGPHATSSHPGASTLGGGGGRRGGGEGKEQGATKGGCLAERTRGG